MVNPKSHVIPANYTPIDLDKDEIIIRYTETPDEYYIITYAGLREQEALTSTVLYRLVAPP